MKKVFLTVAICVVTLLTAAVTIGSYSSVKKPEEPSAVLVTEQTTAASAPSLSGMRSEQIIDSGVFMMRGSLIKSGDTKEITMTVRGEDIAVDMDFYGSPARVLTCGGRSYLLNNETKTYVELSSSLLTMMDIDTSELGADPGELGTGGVPVDEFEENGEKVTVLDVGGRFVRRRYRDAELVAIEDLDEAGTVETRFEIDWVTSDIPADVLGVPSDYTCESIYSFMKRFVDA
ncbi:MAG: hypothetical protein K6C36_06790 [Clostridia bacterium]|nr:hypothetical protein [Clostridia bacterium]